MVTLVSPALRLRLLKWHRWVTLALMIQLGIWLITALIMTLISRESLTTYQAPAATPINAVESWPELSALQDIAGDEAADITLQAVGPTTQIRINDDTALDPITLRAPTEKSAEEIAQIAAEMTDEPITTDQVSLKTKNTVEYQKLPTPAWRVEAQKATLFFDPVTGDYITQTTRMRFLENLVTTIHIMDWSGQAIFRKNIVLTFFGLLFFSAGLMGVLAFKKLYWRKRAIPTRMKIHQIVGLVLAIQVFFWVSSGLGVVWLLHPLRDQAEHILLAEKDPIRWTDVSVHPRDIYKPDDPRGVPQTINLTMVLDDPAYQVQWSGRNPDQALWNARTGQSMTLTEADRDRIARARLVPAASDTLHRWDVASGPQDLDFYFYTGPYPVWKGFFDAPTAGGVAIDQVTGHVHVPRTGNEIFLERYYNVHVVNWRFQVVQYRREPALLAVIALGMLLFVSGVLIQFRRWRATGKI